MESDCSQIPDQKCRTKYELFYEERPSSISHGISKYRGKSQEIRVNVSSDKTNSLEKHRQIFSGNQVESVTGPLTQATGPPRSDAGVGIGMLRGNPVLSAN